MKRNIILLFLLLLAACSTKPVTTSTPERGEINEKASPSPTVDPQIPVTFITEDGIEIAGTLFGEGGKAIIFAHQGTAFADKTTWYPMAEEMAGRGFTALAIDFRGVGDSSGTLEYGKLDKDVKAAIKYLREMGFEEIFCVGASMGGTACVRAALEDDLSGLVVLASTMVAGGGGGGLLKIEPEELANLTLPKLFLTAVKDSYLVVEDTQQMYELSPQPKRLRLFPGKEHGTKIFETDSGDELAAILIEFLENPSEVSSTAPYLFGELRGTTGPIYSLSWSPDGEILATAGFGQIKIWDPTTLEELAALDLHTSNVWGLAWSPDGKYLASAGQDGSVFIWDSRSHLMLKEFNTGWAFSVAWSPDSKQLAVGTRSGRVQLWDIEAKEQVAAYRGASAAISLAWKPDSDVLAMGFLDGEIIIWDVKGEEVLNVLEGNPIHRSDTNGLAWLPDGSKLLSAHQDKIARIWDMSLSEPDFLSMQPHDGWVRGVAWSPNGLCMATGGEDATLRIWDPLSGEILFASQIGSQPIWSLAWSPDGLYLAVGDGLYERKDTEGYGWIWKAPDCES